MKYITQLEDTYNWSLTQDRVRLDDGEHVEIARRLTASNQSTDLLAKLTPFREGLQQFVTQLNEIQDEMHSCQSIPTHELSSQIQVGLDDFIYLSIHLSINLDYPQIHPSTPPFINSSFDTFNRLSIHPSIHLLIYPSIYGFTWLFRAWISTSFSHKKPLLRQPTP